MQETEYLLRVCGSAELQRCLEPQQLALEDFLVVRVAKSSSKGQPRVPHSAVFHRKTIVMQKINGSKSVFI